MGKLSTSQLLSLKVENEGCAWTFYRVSEEENRKESFNFSLHKCSILKLLTVLYRKATINLKRCTEDVNLYVSQRCYIYRVFTLLTSAAAWHILSSTTKTVRL
jgi:predicted membrane channel-forming protein YqfA (hemolysin III family)